MEPTGTCPRGHEVEENAVYCTVCWVRLVPEDAEVLAARSRHRRFRLPFLAAGAVIVGAGVGLVLSQTRTVEPALVAEPPPSAAAVVVAAEPTAPAENLVTVSQPEAATVADPVIASESACTVAIDDATAPCSLTDDQLVFQTCVPEQTVTLQTRTRATEDDEWTDVSTDVVLGAGDGCSDGLVTADVVIDSPVAGTGEVTWKLVARDNTGEKLWKSKFTTTSSAE